MPTLSPAEARVYIDLFSKHTIKGADHVVFECGEIILFRDMTDAQAVRVARALMEIEAQAVRGIPRRARH